MSSPKPTNPPRSLPQMAARLARLPSALALLTVSVRIAAATVTSLALAGCASPSPIATVAPFCEVMHDTCISKKDALTEGTAKKLEGDNLSLRRMCARKNECKGDKAKLAFAVRDAGGSIASSDDTLTSEVRVVIASPPPQ